ncbi:MAG: hypothetical protein IPM16_03990 [Chloroflexi bacterium]|nr:hypothetical protein [Chloroflexota bacterium]
MAHSPNLLTEDLDHSGTVRTWLACGPIVTPLQNLDQVVNPAGNAFGAGRRWALSYWAFHPEVLALKSRVYRLMPAPDLPVRPELGQTGPGGVPWRSAAVAEDQAVDFSVFNYRPSHMEGWLHTTLTAKKALTLSAELVTIGPAQVWVDSELVAQSMAFSYVEPIVFPFMLDVGSGTHTLTIHGSMVGWREARLALGLRFRGQPAVTTGIPIAGHDAATWRQAAHDLDCVYADRFVVTELPGQLTLSANAPHPVPVIITTSPSRPQFNLPEVVSPDLPEHRTTATLSVGGTVDLPLTPEQVAALMRLREAHNVQVRVGTTGDAPVSVTRPIWVSSFPYHDIPHGTYDTRRHTALEHLAQIRYDVLGSLAAVTLGHTRLIDADAVTLACHYLNQRYDCADFFALSLLAALYHHRAEPILRDDDYTAIERAFLGFKYWIDEPGLDGMCYITENHQILFHVTAYLAGQFWPDRIFANSGYTGRQQMARSRPRIETWILRRLRGGFSEWDSNTYLTMDTFAMLSLVELANSARLREMAAALLHKIFFMLASQSFRGAHGSSHGRCYVDGLKTARADATSGMQQIAWGMGNFNGETHATSMLALAQRYRVPEVLQRIGADVSGELVTRARSNGRFRPQFDIHRGEWDIRTITRRTPTSMLAAAVDYRPGQRGIQEHLWQATLGPEAVVFTTYPGNNQEHGNARPNYWAGSARLPRVGMHGRTVICLYSLDAAVGLGFSHAYFPCAEFDEHVIRGAWAFARLGDAYLALWGDGPLALLDRGPYAGQELRSENGGHAWICTVGSAADDGDWHTFIAKVEQNVPIGQGTRVEYRTPDGESLVFGWEGHLKVDGRAVDWAAFPHYENKYTSVDLGAERMDISYDGDVLSLDLARGGVRAEAPGTG